MKRITILAMVLMITTVIMAQKKEEVMTKEKGVYVIKTESLCDFKGYKSTVPLQITVKKNNIVKVEALPNTETPKFFHRIITEMLPKYTDIKFEDYSKVDGVTGATKSSNAVKENMKVAYEYYKKNK